MDKEIRDKIKAFAQHSGLVDAQQTYIWAWHNLPRLNIMNMAKILSITLLMLACMSPGFANDEKFFPRNKIKFFSRVIANYTILVIKNIT